MAEILTNLAPYLGPSGILCAVIVYIVIQSQRSTQTKHRDENEKLVEYRLDQLEKTQSGLSTSIGELQKSIISLQMSVNDLLAEIRHMKELK